MNYGISMGSKNWNSGTTTKISGDTVIDVTADISSAKGVYLWNGSKAEIGGNAVVTVKKCCRQYHSAWLEC